MREEQLQAAVFLDRDGTINEEVGYLDRLENLRLIPGASEAIRLINASGMKAVVVTNQSGVARGLYDEAFVEKAHARLRELLRREGAHLDGLYFCPHHPSEGRGEYLRACDCRKPAPGLLMRAAEELRIDLSLSWMIGDTLKDIEAGARAGTKGILVRTGYGEAELRKLEETASSPKPYGNAVATGAGAGGILVRIGLEKEELRMLGEGSALSAPPDDHKPGSDADREIPNPNGLGKKDLRNLEKGDPSQRLHGKRASVNGGFSQNGRPADPRQPEFIAADLLEAVEWIMRGRRP